VDEMWQAWQKLEVHTIKPEGKIILMWILSRMWAG
jgi:hypothetical protein